MARFAAKRLAGMAAVLFAVSVIVFAIYEVIPNGDPAQRIAGRSADAALIESIEEKWGLDRPLPARYAAMMGNVLSGELVSYETGQEVYERLSAGLPATLSLVFGAAVIWLVAGIGVGYWSAVRAGGAGDRVLGVLAALAISLPVFWVGAVLLHFLASEAALLPAGGYVPLSDDPFDWASHLLLPWLTMALAPAAVLSRLVRSRMLEAMHEDYVTTARAKGVPEREVRRRHVLRGALAPVVAAFGLELGAAFAGGAIIVEWVYGLDGVGQYAAESIASLDLPPIMAVTLLGAFAVVVVGALADLANGYLDPRVRAAPARR
jgi:peptide/nickel transport system permease protein